MAKLRLVLIGGGHAHVQVVRALSEAVLASHFGAGAVEPVLVSEEESAAYSGMVPGAIAGLYTGGAMLLNLRELAGRHGWAFVQGRVQGVRGRAAGWEAEDGARGTLDFDVLSLNVGSRTRPLPGAARRERVVMTRPIARLLQRVERFEQAGRADTVLVLGAGAAGVELAFALEARWRERGVRVVVADGGGSVLAGCGKSVRELVGKELEERGIRVLLGYRAVRVREGENVVDFDNGEVLRFDLLVVATGAAPHPWLANDTDLETDENGFMLVKPSLQSVSNDRIFGAGDCVSFGTKFGDNFPPKAGVYAVRQAPVLIQNILTVLHRLGGVRTHVDKSRIVEYTPQKSFLSLIMTGNQSAIGTKYGVAFKGRWVWRLKDYIDRKWMEKLEVDPGESDNEDGSNMHKMRLREVLKGAAAGETNESALPQHDGSLS